VVVVLLPSFGQLSGLVEVVEIIHLQKLVPETTVERFDKSVLPARAWCNIEGVYAQVGEPSLNLPSDEFTAVVRANVARRTPFACEPTEHIQYVFTFDGAPHMQCQALAGELVQYYQKFQCTAIGGSIVDKIPSPYLVWRRGRTDIAGIGIDPNCAGPRGVAIVGVAS